jgi:hypothetical protein
MRPHYDFISLSKELLPPGSLFDTRTIPFNFRGVEKIHEVSVSDDRCLDDISQPMHILIAIFR